MKKWMSSKAIFSKFTTHSLQQDQNWHKENILYVWKEKAKLQLPSYIHWVIVSWHLYPLPFVSSIPVIACHICLSEDEKVIIFYRNEASVAVGRSIKIQLLFLCTFSAIPLSLSLQVIGIWPSKGKRNEEQLRVRFKPGVWKERATAAEPAGYGTGIIVLIFMCTTDINVCGTYSALSSFSA